MLEHEELTERIIQAAIAVHRQLGPGFLESIYEEALCIEFRKGGLQFDRQRRLPILYDSIEIGFHRLDLLVEETIVVELKAVKRIEEIHFAVVRSYLKAAKLKHGLLLDWTVSSSQSVEPAADAVNKNSSEEGRKAGNYRLAA